MNLRRIRSRLIDKYCDEVSEIECKPRPWALLRKINKRIIALDKSVAVDTKSKMYLSVYQ